MRKEVGVGLDIGTSGLKCTVIDLSRGKVIGHRRVEYHQDDTDTGIVPVRMYTEALERLLADLVEEFRVRSIAVTTAWYSVMGTANGKDLVYQWNSYWERNPAIERELLDYLDASGCDVDTRFPVYKLMTARFLHDESFRPYGIKEYLIEWLTGQKVTDFSTASASGLVDIRKRDWNDPLLDALGYRREHLPKLELHNKVIGETRFKGETITVVPGLGDGGAASYACQAMSDITANIGTSMAVRELAPTIRKDTSARIWTFIIDESRYVNGGVSSNGCAVLNWARRMKWPIDEVRVKHGAELFFPWLHGERTPFHNADPRGTFTGIDMRTDSASLASAIIRGVAFTLSRMVNAIADARHRNSSVVVAGGGIHLSELLRVIQGSVNVPLSVLKSHDFLASDGAALSMAEAFGIPAIDLNHEIEMALEPNDEFRADYEAWLSVGNKLASEIYQTSS